MFRRGEGSRLDLPIVGGESFAHGRPQIGEVLDELRFEIGEQGQHVLIDKNLAVAACAGSDADGGDGEFLAYDFGQFGGDSFQYHRKSAGLFDDMGIFDELLSCIDALPLNLETAEGVDGLRSQPDMGAYRNTGIDDGANLFRHRSTAFELDRIRAAFFHEAARIDGASPLQQFIHLTIPLLKPTILLTAIMSTSGTLQLFDESVNLTAGGPGKATMTLTHYIYNISFVETPKFNYAAALSVFILIVVAVLSAIQMKVGDKRD